MVENLTFFTEDEDLKSIVLANLDEEVVDIKKISTDWTNIVLDVKCKDNSYIFRFPRNNFFSNIIEKDVEANKFLKEHTNIKVVDMRLCYDKNRPFSIHKKIEGKTLMTRMNDLSKKKENEIAEEIAKAFHEIHSVNIDTVPTKCISKQTKTL